jgi:hypothetical protein
MPYKIGWYLRSHVVYLRVWGDVSLLEITEMFQRMEDDRKAYDHPLHVIADWCDVEDFPKNVAHIRRTLVQVEYATLHGHTVLVSGNSAMRSVAFVLIQFRILKTLKHTTNTVDQAMAYLQAQDPTLPPPLLFADWQADHPEFFSD